MAFIQNNKTNWNYILIVIILAAVVGAELLWLSTRQEITFVELPLTKVSKQNKIESPEPITDNNEFRNASIGFVRNIAEKYFDGEQIQYPEELKIKGDWDIDIAIYFKGEIRGEGKAQSKDEFLSLALEQAVKDALADKNYQKLTEEDIEKTRFLVTFSYSPDGSFSFIEYDKQGKELQKDLVIIRSLDKKLIEEKIGQGKEFLFRAQHKEENGFYKKYDTLNDDFGNRLHTVYSASIIYTLLKVYDFDEDKRILEQIPEWADFLLSMQNKTEKEYGAFHYSFFLESQEKELKFVVGTAALSIFTLLDLYEREGDSKYLEVAKLGGDWLLTMQKEDGSMQSYKRYLEGKWFNSKKESLLYNGQVLSALSRLYKATGDKRYFNSAQKIAQRFVDKIEEEGCYLGDDYRIKNPISSAWAIMSLLDFYQVKQEDHYKNLIFQCSEELLQRQSQNTANPLSYGSFSGAYSTSGNGWLAEVMMEMYHFCREQNRNDCDKYKDALTEVMMWLMQNTYSEENTFFLLEPEKAIGGLFWNYKERYVRTDSICHGLNAYVGIINNLEDDFLLLIPERPFEQVLSDLKKEN